MFCEDFETSFLVISFSNIKIASNSKNVTIVLEIQRSDKFYVTDFVSINKTDDENMNSLQIFFRVLSTPEPNHGESKLRF